MDKIAGFCEAVGVYDASWGQSLEHPSNPFVSSGDETPIDHGQASRLRSMRTGEGFAWYEPNLRVE